MHWRNYFNYFILGSKRIQQLSSCKYNTNDVYLKLLKTKEYQNQLAFEYLVWIEPKTAILQKSNNDLLFR